MSQLQSGSLLGPLSIPIVTGHGNLVGLEIAQVIQDFPGQSTTLIADKTTLVRAYLDSVSTSASSVRGELAVRTTLTGQPVVIASLGPLQLDASLNGQTQAKRENLQLSLNFLLPAARSVAGKLFVSLLRLIDVTSGQEIPCDNINLNREVEFKSTPPLRVRIIGLRYSTGQPPRTYAPSALDFDLIESWLKRAYPISKLIVSRTTVDANDAWPFECTQANAQVSALRSLDISAGADARMHYFGLVADGGGFMRGCASVPSTPNPAAVGSGPTGPSDWGWDFDGSYGDWYTGHELGHTFGRPHPGFCNGNTADDPNFPYKSGQIGDNTYPFVGLDVGDVARGIPMAALPPGAWHDVMTYCPRQWLSAYTFEAIRNRLIAEDAIGASPGAGSISAPAAATAMALHMPTGSLISIVATVNLTQGSGMITYVNPVSNAVLSKPVFNSPVSVRLVRDDQTVAVEEGVDVKWDTCDQAGEDRTGVVDLALPLDPSGRIVELLVAGKVVDRYEGPPAVQSALAVVAAAAAVSNIHRVASTLDSVIFEWDVPQSDIATAKVSPVATRSPIVHYNVQISTDGGQSWQTIAVGSKNPRVTVDRSQLHSAAGILLRVTATDGFTSTTNTSPSFDPAQV